MKKYVGLAAVAAMIAGCAPAASNKQIYLPDGQQGFTINCNGVDTDWSACYDEAGKICGAAGYRIVDKASEKGYVKQTGNDFLDGFNSGRSGQGNFFYRSHTTHTRTLVIACNTGGAVSATVPVAQPAKK